MESDMLCAQSLRWNGIDFRAGAHICDWINYLPLRVQARGVKIFIRALRCPPCTHLCIYASMRFPFRRYPSCQALGLVASIFFFATPVKALLLRWLPNPTAGTSNYPSFDCRMVLDRSALSYIACHRRTRLRFISIVGYCKLMKILERTRNCCEICSTGLPRWFRGKATPSIFLGNPLKSPSAMGIRLFLGKEEISAELCCWR